MSERIAAGEILTSTVTGERIDTDPLPTSTEPDRSRKEGVRQCHELAPPPPNLANFPYRPAHPSNRLVAQLNANWRVVNDPLQWRLQRRKGNPRTRNSGWQDRSFCTTRKGLLRCVCEYCGDVEPAALAKLAALPEHYEMQNLDVRGTDQAHANGQPKPLVSEALEGCEPGDQPPRNSQPALS